jgi:hypothetical protein
MTATPFIGPVSDGGSGCIKVEVGRFVPDLKAPVRQSVGAAVSSTKSVDKFVGETMGKTRKGAGFKGWSRFA